MSDEQSDAVLVVRWYTRARKFPQLIGKTHDGTRLPGGPYTVTQVLGGGVTFFVLYKTMGLWAHSGLIGNWAAVIGLTAATVWGLGKIPIGARNPVTVANGFLNVVSGHRLGTIGGRPLRIRGPRQVGHMMLATAAQAPRPHLRVAVDHVADPVEDIVVLAPAVKPTSTLTSVQSLLAGHTSTRIGDI